MAIEFRVLGRLEVVRDGQPVHIGSRQQRVILAALAIQRNTAVANDCLAELVWSGTPPPSADVTLRGLVSRLRRTLGSAGERLIASDGGYLLAASGEEVDADQFTQLTRRGDRHLAAGSIDTAVEEFGRALDLWRGGFALADLADTEGGRVLIAQLERERATAVEALAEAHLAAGNPSDALRLLEGHVEAYPLRERTWELLLTALYRLGRQADAHLAYRRVRETLRDELGVEPGHGLRRLHHQILAQDPALDSDRSDRSPAQHAALPVALTPIVGRDAELGALAEDMAHSRLLTLTGLGGIGKTRLAIELARRHAARWDAVRLMELGGSTATVNVASQLARVLGVPGAQDRDPLALAADSLADRRVLLVMDNCEHLLAQVAGVVGFLLSRCPGLTVLATSREPLAVSGETVRFVPALTLPGPGVATPDELNQSAAVILFCQRAKATQSGFGLTEANAEDVGRICRRLDGIPLAIELAAARLRALSIHEIAVRLDDRFALLTSGSRTALPRQQTLRATMDWSYGLLSPEEQAALRALTVFPVDFEAVAASAVVGPTANGGDADDVVFRLIDKSLVVVRRRSGETRYELLETVRAYAGALLDQLGERAAARRRHRDHYRRVAADWRAAVVTPSWSRRLAAEEANLRTATMSALADADGPGARDLLRGAWPYWTVLGRAGDIAWYEQALSLPGDDVKGRAEVAIGLTLLTLWEMGPTRRAEELIDSAIELAENAGADATLAWAHYFRGEVLMARGDLQGARREYRTGMLLVPPVGSVAFRHALGWVCIAAGDVAGARAEFEEVIAAGTEGDLHVTHARAGLAVLIATPRNDRAVKLADGAVAEARRSMVPAILVMALVRAAQTLLLSRRDDEAAVALQEVLGLLQQLGTRAYQAEALDAAAVLAHRRGEPLFAVRLLGAAAAVRRSRAESIGFEVLAEELESVRAAAVAELGGEAVLAAMDEACVESAASVGAEVRSWLSTWE